MEAVEIRLSPAVSFHHPYIKRTNAPFASKPRTSLLGLFHHSSKSLLSFRLKNVTPSVLPVPCPSPC